ncbi:hypothetical protein A9Q84_08240 [Halobacteriovorax marinus]|uniref:Uncharacterized protein n=1 Tax=Halobacteriovorax marinus TaxID=97084 RepID=A0A1Y5F6H8_9BACT|nr:hypothetical protein A9Q84_08240 [Halobacteriovorax marinus]
MLSRKEQTTQPIALPKEWTKKVCDLLNEVYESQCNDVEKTFEVYGSTYADEFLFITSLVSPKDDKITPVSYFISKDLDDSTEAEKMLDDLVDSIGSFFDVYFASKDWSDYQAEWLEAEFKGHKFFYKISRENIGLHLMADNLLNQ